MNFISISSNVLAEEAVQSSASAPAYVLEKLRRNDIVFMGTTHKQPAILAMLAQLLPRLHAAGVTDLALEIASDQQDALERFLSHRKGMESLVLHSAIDCPEYRNLLNAMAALPTELRFRVKAVDLPPDLYGGVMDRDQWMAGKLAQILQHRKDAKVMAIVGSLHVLRKLPWLPRIVKGPLSIRYRLGVRQPDLSMFSIVNIVPDVEPHCDFGRLLGPLPGVTALDLDSRFQGWTLGLTRCIAIAPAEPYELVDGVIVY